MAANPYAAPAARLSESAPRLPFAVRAVRMLAFLGNAFLLALPLLLFSSTGRAHGGFLILCAYAAGIAAASVLGLAMRDRFSFWAAFGANAVGVLALAVFHLSGRGADDWTVVWLGLPAVLNLAAVLLVRRSRGPSDDTLAARR